jgi:hypothetical protein
MAFIRTLTCTTTHFVSVFRRIKGIGRTRANTIADAHRSGSSVDSQIDEMSRLARNFVPISLSVRNIPVSKAVCVTTTYIHSPLVDDDLITVSNRHNDAKFQDMPPCESVCQAQPPCGVGTTILQLQQDARHGGSSVGGIRQVQGTH